MTNNTTYNQCFTLYLAKIFEHEEFYEYLEALRDYRYTSLETDALEQLRILLENFYREVYEYMGVSNYSTLRDIGHAINME